MFINLVYKGYIYIKDDLKRIPVVVQFPNFFRTVWYISGKVLNYRFSNFWKFWKISKNEHFTEKQIFKNIFFLFLALKRSFFFIFNIFEICILIAFHNRIKRKNRTIFGFCLFLGLKSIKIQKWSDFQIFFLPER